MNAFSNGTRVFFFGGESEVKYGTVVATNRMSDGTQIITIDVDHENRTVSLPVSTVSKVN